MLAMLKFFADDSGSDVDPNGVFVLAGYLMEEPRWVDFAEKWDIQLKRPHAIDYFHMVEAEGGEGQFLGIDRIHRNRKVLDLAEVIREVFPPALVCVMHWKDYNAHIRGRVHPDLDNPYAVLFFKIMRVIAELQIKMNETLTEEDKQRLGVAIKPVDFIFDDQSSAGLQSLRWYGTLKPRVAEPHKTIIANTPQFKDDKELTPLQAADMLAWHVRRAYTHRDEDRRKMLDHITPDGLWEYTVSSDELANIAYAFKTRVDIKSA